MFKRYSSARHKVTILLANLVYKLPVTIQTKLSYHYIKILKIKKVKTLLWLMEK